MRVWARGTRCVWEGCAAAARRSRHAPRQTERKEALGSGQRSPWPHVDGDAARPRRESGAGTNKRGVHACVVTECERGHNHKGARERCIVNCRFPLSGVEPVSPRPAWTGERGCVRLTTREPARRRAHGATVRTDGPDRGRNTDHAVHRSSHIGQRAGIQKRPAGLTLKPYRIT